MQILCFRPASAAPFRAAAGLPGAARPRLA